MKIAFYAPLKMPDHPVPSGDRLMARLLVAALEKAGHDVNPISDLRSYSRTSEPSSYREIEALARAEIMRISEQWGGGTPADIWFSYHPYYKAPDLLGPTLSKQFHIPYFTAETSYSGRRNTGYWVKTQQNVLNGIRQAAVNICFTKRDQEGIAATAPDAQTAMLRPFILPEPFLGSRPQGDVIENRLITVAMMRPGDKMDSYRLLADALARLSSQLPWSLSIIGDGKMKAEVKQLFARFPADRIIWHGQATTAEIAARMSQSAAYVWPGFGEAYGLAYLEAQAAGLPVVAMNVAGVPEAVDADVTGLLTSAGDADAYAKAIEQVLTDEATRIRMGRAARQMIVSERTLDRAALVLDEILTKWTQPIP